VSTEADVPSFLDQIRDLFTPTRVLDLPLEIHLDVDDQDRHAVRIGYTIDGQTTWVRDVPSLWGYGGFQVRKDGETYVIPIEDQDVLAALHSVRAEISPSGLLAFDFYPPMLEYLRQNHSVIETDASRELRVLKKPLELGANVDFDGREGIKADTGFRDPETGDLVSQSDLETTSDGGFARLGKTFVPLPKQISDRAREWLQRGRAVISPDHIPEFFKRDLVLLKTDFNAVLTDAASQVKVVDLPDAPRVKVESDQKGWLDFQLDYVVEGHAISWETIWGGRGETVRPDPSTFVHIPRDEPERVLKTITKMPVQETESGFRVPISQFASLEDFIKEIGGRREVNAAYEAFLEDLEDFEAREDFQLSIEAEGQLLLQGIKLRRYQRAGIHWLTWLVDHHLHGLLADDMGLGKTIQTAAALRHAWEKNDNPHHSLIVCPKSVIRHWARELKRCDPTLRVYEYIGTNRDKDFWTRSRPGVAISTYATTARDAEIISQVPLFFLVLDESTKIKNPQTQRAQAVKALNAAHRIALSGTPVENRPAELWSVFDFLMRGHLGKYGTFQRTFETPILRGSNKAAERLGERVGPFVLRRKKEEVAKDLPQKVEMDEWVELSDEQRTLYVAIQNSDAEPMRQSLKGGARVDYPGILAILMKLKQVCDHPALVTGETDPIEGRSEKFDRILELIEDIVEGEDLVVLFSQWLDTLSLFEKALKHRRISWVRLDGSVDMATRQRRIDRFNKEKADVALCSLQAVGHGVNLTAANHVIHVDRWWNPAIEDQATDRLHRIGQTKTVFVHHVQTSDTLEEKIADLQARKRGLSDRIMAAADRPLKWTRQELLELLKPLP
jgi:SNF2 family DNA or RNA helicase